MNKNFFDLVSEFVKQSLHVSLPAFAPELAICATIVVMLLVRMPRFGRRLNSFWIALPGTMIALAACAPWKHLQPGDTCKISGSSFFDGMLIFDQLTVY